MDQSIYHKNLMPVVYVTGDVAGDKESPVYAILEMYKKIEAIAAARGLPDRPAHRRPSPTATGGSP